VTVTARLIVAVVADVTVAPADYAVLEAARLSLLHLIGQAGESQTLSIVAMIKVCANFESNPRRLDRRTCANTLRWILERAPSSSPRRGWELDHRVCRTYVERSPKTEASFCKTRRSRTVSK